MRILQPMVRIRRIHQLKYFPGGQPALASTPLSTKNHWKVDQNRTFITWSTALQSVQQSDFSVRLLLKRVSPNSSAPDRYFTMYRALNPKRSYVWLFPPLPDSSQDGSTQLDESPYKLSTPRFHQHPTNCPRWSNSAASSFVTERPPHHGTESKNQTRALWIKKKSC
jgi:hypothetical protein